MNTATSFQVFKIYMVAILMILLSGCGSSEVPSGASAISNPPVDNGPTGEITSETVSVDVAIAPLSEAVQALAIESSAADQTKKLKREKRKLKRKYKRQLARAKTKLKRKFKKRCKRKARRGAFKNARKCWKKWGKKRFAKTWKNKKAKIRARYLKRLANLNPVPSADPVTVQIRILNVYFIGTNSHVSIGDLLGTGQVVDFSPSETEQVRIEGQVRTGRYNGVGIEYSFVSDGEAAQVYSSKVTLAEPLELRMAEESIRTELLVGQPEPDQTVALRFSLLE